VPVSSRSLPVKVSSGPISVDPQPLSVPFAQGDVIADKYEVVGLLGSGGVAYVISALHLELGEMVALKFLRPESLAFPDVVARFASEARAVARIKSEHVAHVFDVGTLPDGAPFIVMEHLEGRDLADVLAEKRRVPVKVAVDYVLQACEALACAHSLGIVHRDIKPENLYLSQQAGSVEVVKVLDFGISKSAMGAPGGRESAKTMLPMGTPGYMSPEQIRACGDVDARTDIWALGCVLSELITGTSAFEAPTQIQLGAAILERDPVPLRQKIKDVSPELEAIVLRCLAKDPAQRYQDVAELALALYPFGPRRSRISAERCHEVLRGKSGVVMEFNSVPPPPSSDDDAVTALRQPLLSAIPSSAPSHTPVRTTSPATLTSIGEPPPFKRNGRGMLVLAAVAVAALIGIGLGLRDGAVPAASVPHAAATLQPTPGAPAAVAAAERPASRTSAIEEPVMLPAAAPTPSTEALEVEAPRPKPTRAQRAAAAAAAKREAAAQAAKAKPVAVKRAAPSDDSEPDVGY
jgi:eukaryotic-like serine/threonine-protein kinase